MQASTSPPAVRRALSATLVDELRRQNQAFGESAARQAHLAALSHPELGAIVTGQQVGLFLGPAYSFYKAATTVVLARRIAARDGRPTVPIFWLQSEDHDVDEIDTARVLNADGELACFRVAARERPRVSLSARALGDDVAGALAALAAHLAGAPHLSDTLAVLERGYQPGQSWVNAFASVLASVFADEGLLLLDPRTPAIGHLAAPTHRDALVRADAYDEAVRRGAEALERAGEAVQVRPRAGCSLSFYHPEGCDGPRHRLIRRAGGWTHPSAGEISTAELLAHLEREPLAFSTSALLRVILEDTLLPTLAQVAGPGEARYLRQLPPLYAACDMAPSRIVPRVRIVVVDERSRKSLEQLGASSGALADREALLRRLAEGDEGPRGHDVAARLRQAVDQQMTTLAPALTALDPSLARAMERTRRHVDKGVTRLGERVERARARRDQTRVDRVDGVCRRLWPMGGPQERTLSFPHFAAHHGLAAFKRATFSAAEAHLDAIERGEADRAHEVTP